MIGFRRALRLCLAACTSLATPAMAAEWPDRTVTLVVPFAPGGITDVLARLTAERLQTRLKQNVIVENTPGAAGTIAATRVARAPPDGYTLFMGTLSQFAIAPFTHKIRYDPIKDFTPISLVGTSPFVITVGKDFPAKSMPEFIAYVKANPGKVTYGSAGAGSLTHMVAALFSLTAGLEMSHVPYRGIAPAFQDLVGGHIAMMSPSPVELRPYLAKGDLRPLAVSIDKRSKAVPEVPPVTDFVKMQPVVTWNGVVAPGNVPQIVVDTLSKELMTAGADPKFLEALEKIGVEPVVHTPADFAKLIAADLELWRTVIPKLGLQAK